MIFILHKQNGVIGAKLNDYIKDLPDGQYRISIEKFRKTRTNNQNRLYWAFLRLIEVETGQDANDVHEVAKRKFLQPRFVEIQGEEVRLPATTTTLNKLEFGEYMDKIENWTGIPIPQEINV